MKWNMRCCGLFFSCVLSSCSSTSDTPIGTDSEDAGDTVRTEAAAPPPVSLDSAVGLPTHDAALDAAIAPSDGAPARDALVGAADGAREIIDVCPPAPQPCAIMPVGDSITWIPEGYRVVEFHLSLAAKKSITYVGSQANGPQMVDGLPYPQHHEGYPGYEINQIAALIDNALDAYHPQVVQLLIGTNDIGGNDDLSHAPDRYGKLLDQIFARVPNAMVIGSTVTPLVESTNNGRVMAYNEGITHVIAAQAAAGRRLIMVDIYAAFVANPNYKTEYLGPDGVHPSAQGFAVMGSVWYKALAPYLH